MLLAWVLIVQVLWHVPLRVPPQCQTFLIQAQQLHGRRFQELKIIPLSIKKVVILRG